MSNGSRNYAWQAGFANAGRVVNVVPPDNTAYHASLSRPEHRLVGDTAWAVWQRIIRHTDRFVAVHPDVFWDSDITSREYGLRYAKDVVRNQDELFSWFEIAEPLDIEDVIDFEGDIELHEDVVILRIGTVGTGLQYPFPDPRPERARRRGRRRDGGRVLMQIRVVRGDITHQQVAAIVTAANRGLRGGGGVDGAVHRAAGPRLLEACRPLDPCPAGSAVVTEAFDLAPVSWVIRFDSIIGLPTISR